MNDGACVKQMARGEVQTPTLERNWFVSVS